MEVVRMLTRSHPKIAEMLEAARDDLSAFTGFPTAHWRQIWYTNPLERVNKEINRRTDVVGTFPAHKPREYGTFARGDEGISKVFVGEHRDSVSTNGNVVFITRL